jgi:hypothetical protein
MGTQHRAAHTSPSNEFSPMRQPVKRASVRHAARKSDGDIGRAGVREGARRDEERTAHRGHGREAHALPPRPPTYLTTAPSSSRAARRRAARPRAARPRPSSPRPPSTSSAAPPLGARRPRARGEAPAPPPRPSTRAASMTPTPSPVDLELTRRPPAAARGRAARPVERAPPTVEGARGRRTAHVLTRPDRDFATRFRKAHLGWVKYVLWYARAGAAGTGGGI